MISGRQLILPWDRASDPSFLRSREWLLTNGLGGYASGTLSGMPARKYHGLLVPNLTAPKGRHILISRCDEVISVGAHRLHLGGAEFESDAVGESHRYLREFRLDHRIAMWRFEFEGRVLEKSIVMPHNHNTVCVLYRLLQGEPIELRVRPYLLFRRHDEAPRTQLAQDFTLSVQRGRHEIRHAALPIVLRMAMLPGPAAFVTDEQDEIEFRYRIEAARGDPAFETAFSPGHFTQRLTSDAPTAFAATTHDWESLQFDPPAIFEAERQRAAALLACAPWTRGDELAEQLVMAADQFIVLPGSRLEENMIAQAAGSELRTIYAGYHWFGDWGRDTMISLEGLTLCTGRKREAGAILRTFSHYVRDGLLPNLFPEGEREALYHTVDATLWYFHAISRYVAATGDRAIIAQLFPVLQAIVEHHVRGTRFNIHVASDGLIAAAAEGLQLTWMDAKVDGWVVTPRRGKPVEIQALWFNALRLMERWAKELGHSPRLYEQQAARVQRSFIERFWNPQTGCLYDVVDGPDGDDPAIRPNQIFTVSLEHPILDRDRWRAVVETVQHRLLTPYGLRTLSAEHPDYRAHYRGDLRARDAAYHQGTVWPWLIGHFIDAYLKVNEQPANARRLLMGFRDHLLEAGVGSISEVFDAEEPYSPGGCIAQAWSVAEVLRAWMKTA